MRRGFPSLFIPAKAGNRVIEALGGNTKPHYPVDSWGVFKDARCADCFAWDLTEEDPLSRFVWFAADGEWECQRCGERTPYP